MVHSFGGYDTIRDTVLVGPLRGNFLASFAVGWVCTTVSLVLVFFMATLDPLSGLARVPLGLHIPWILSAVG